MYIISFEYPSLSSVITSALVIFSLVVAIHRRFFAPNSAIPGPFWASVTRLWHAYYILRGDHDLRLIDLHEKLGYFVRIAPSEVSVSHPDGPCLLLQAPLRKGNWYRVFAIPDYRYVTPQSTLDTKEKVERSKLFASGFSLSHVLRSEDSFDSNIGYLLDWMDEYSRTNKPMHLDKFFTYTAFDNAGEAVFSQPFGFITKGYDIRGSIKNSRALNCYMALKKRIEDPNARFDMVAHWLKAQQENPEHVGPRHIEAQAITSVAAGSDTVSCALQTFIYHMIKHPLSWQRVRSEIEMAQTEGRCKDRVISYRDSQQLPYLQVCIKEALRMFGPGPFGLPRVAPRGGITIGGHHFPEGTVLSINPHVMQRSQDCWGPDVKQWNPDRWFADDIQSKYTKYWLVYGLGYNKCPGEHLAHIQISKIAATIVRDYSIHQVDPQKPWKWEAYFLVVPHSWLVYVTKRISSN